MQRQSASLDPPLYRVIPSNSSSPQRLNSVMSPFHPHFALYKPSWSPTCDIRSLCKSSSRAYGQARSKYHPFSGVAFAKSFEQLQYNYPSPPQVPPQPTRPLMATHFIDGCKAVRSRMQWKLEDDRGAAKIRGRGRNARFCTCLHLSTGVAIDSLQQVSIPRTAQAVAAHCFPVNVTLRTPCKRMLRAFVENTSIQVVRSVVLSAEGKKSEHTCGIGRGKVQQIESELVDGNTRIIRAFTRAGVFHGEYSWKIGDIAEVKVGY